MIICDGTIRRLIRSGRLVVEPYHPSFVQPASLDVTLGEKFLRESHLVGTVNTKDLPENLMVQGALQPDGSIWIDSKEFILATIVERVEIPSNMVARVEGKSSIGRLGLVVHATAGFIDPGFKGQITLELCNLSSHPLQLWPGQQIAQLSFEMLDKEAERPYGHPELNSHYQNQEGVVGSRYGQD